MKKIVIALFSIFVLIVFSFALYFFVNYQNYVKYSSFINSSAIEYNIDYLLIVAVIKAESNFNSNVVSNKGAVGLMQIMPATAKSLVNNNPKYTKFEINDLYDPKTNIDLGTAYLQYLLKVFNNDINLAISAYNAGVGNVLKWTENSKIYDEDKILFKETKQYVKKVNKVYNLLKSINRYFGKKQ